MGGFFFTSAVSCMLGEPCRSRVSKIANDVNEQRPKTCMSIYQLSLLLLYFSRSSVSGCYFCALNLPRFIFLTLTHGKHMSACI